jgi:hypothetical protein
MINSKAFSEFRICRFKLLTVRLATVPWLLVLLARPTDTANNLKLY